MPVSSSYFVPATGKELYSLKMEGYPRNLSIHKKASINKEKKKKKKLLFGLRLLWHCYYFSGVVFFEVAYVVGVVGVAFCV